MRNPPLSARQHVPRDLNRTGGTERLGRGVHAGVGRAGSATSGLEREMRRERVFASVAQMRATDQQSVAATL